MTDVSKYLAILAKIMQNTNMYEKRINKDKYDKLYVAIHSELNPILQNSMFPYTSDIIIKTKTMMESMETLYICNELIGKKSILISNHYTNKVFDKCRDLFIDHKFIDGLSKIYTQIPFVIVDTENNENVIEVINHTNARRTLSLEEFQFLIIESVKRNIALNKIIQFIIVKTKLEESQLCIISDNIYMNAEKMFWRSVSHKVAYINSKRFDIINKQKITRMQHIQRTNNKQIKNHNGCNLENFSALFVSDKILANVLNDSDMKNYRIISNSEIVGYIKEHANRVLYGFWDEFISIETQIMEYYNKQLLNAKKTLQEVVSDIVRLDDSDDKTLQSIRMREEYREKTLKSEASNIEIIMNNIEKIIVDICTDLDENVVTGKKILRYTIDDIFEAFFRCEKFNTVLEKKILSKIYSYDYDNYDLVSAYVQMKTGKKVNDEVVEINKIEWEKAKMLIGILNIDNIPEKKLKKYVEVLGEHCSTGKELYAKALVSSGYKKYELLQKSFEKGYENAGNTLLEMYKNGDSKVNVMSLANSLLPEACMIIANQKMEQYKENYLDEDDKWFVDISDDEFTYYKIAATKQYLPAIGKIVDVVFESRFSSGFQIPADDIDNDRYEEMIDNGHVICQLCGVLIAKMYQVKHYSEVLGIVLYSLNENLSEAMRLLTNANSALACYCKAKMYEFGGGVAIDLDKAISNYEHSIKNGFSRDIEKRLAVCKRKIERNLYESNSEEYYQSSKSYHSTSTQTESRIIDDGCFTPTTKILMADGSYCAVDDIKKGDSVVVFDHYTGKLVTEKIVANVHDVSDSRDFDVIEMIFDDRTKLEIVKSHLLYDRTYNKYVWINSKNIVEYIGHSFAAYVDGKLLSKKLVSYSIEIKNIRYYVPISKFHLNVFAESFLTMPPTKLSVSLFPINKDMLYDLTILNEVGLTAYDEISELVTCEEFNALPCKYLSAILKNNNSSIKDFEYVIELFRDHTDS